MPERKSGRQNNGGFCVFCRGRLCGGYGGPVVVLGCGYYRGEALICSLSFLLTACLGIGRVTRSRLIIWLFALAVLSWKVEHTKKFLGSLIKSWVPFSRPSIVKNLTLKISQFSRMPDC